MNNEEETTPEKEEDSAFDRMTNETDDSPPTEMIKAGSEKDKN